MAKKGVLFICLLPGFISLFVRSFPSCVQLFISGLVCFFVCFLVCSFVGLHIVFARTCMLESRLGVNSKLSTGVGLHVFNDSYFGITNSISDAKLHFNPNCSSNPNPNPNLNPNQL